MNEPVCPSCRRTFINCCCDGPDWGFSFEPNADEDAGSPPLDFQALPTEFAAMKKQHAKRKRRVHSRV